MVVLVLVQSAGFIVYVVLDGAKFDEPGHRGAEFILSAPRYGLGYRLLGEGMAARTVRQQQGGVVFAGCAPLQQHPAVMVEGEQRERPVQHPGLAVDLELLCDPERQAVLADRLHEDRLVACHSLHLSTLPDDLSTLARVQPDPARQLVWVTLDYARPPGESSLRAAGILWVCPQQPSK